MHVQIGDDGYLVIPRMAEREEGCDASDEDKMTACFKSSYLQFLAYLYPENANQLKYGLLIKQLSTQFLLQKDQYPKTVTDANNVLSNHRYDQAYHDAKKS